ncbi:putative protein kinase RLK-Pelle-WAK-LRK10L-1 family [Helianthus annuus]|nr:putative protein kinase RLK-Pelle-WAK-LRK10L-1 family [Helianthus annuus]
MLLVFFFVSIVISCLPLLHSATDQNHSIPICPESFKCPALTPFKYPFYNVKDTRDTRCGLIKVNCTSEGGEIHFEGRSYNIFSKLDIDHYSSLLFLGSGTLEQLVSNNSCEALMNNFTSPSPSPLLYSVSLTSFITLFKCTENLTYFAERDYKSYNRCKDYNFYYNYLKQTVPGDLPHACQVVHLPLKVPGPGFDETNIFSLLYSGTSVYFNLSHSCSECQKKGRLCDTKNGNDVQCFDFQKEKESSNRTIKILVPVIPGSALILMLLIVIVIIWRRCKNKPFSYVSSKNKSADLEDISLSCGVSVFSYKELEDATQNFDPSRELGDGGFGAVYYGKLKDGREVAVKKLHEHNYNRVRQFRNEVDILTQIKAPESCCSLWLHL